MENLNYSMQTIKIKFTKIEVPEFEKKGLLPVRFHYTENGTERVLQKDFGYVKEEPLVFAEDLVAQVKHVCRKSMKPNPLDYGPLSGYVNIVIDEEREGITTEKLANALKKVRDRIRTIKGMAHADNYMNKYVEVKGLVMEL